jgi:DNA repair protein RecN (Recombination protein N)
MLQKLYIRNYAIIDDLTISFHPRFNIITGETGAGKSILMGALGLVLGNRAESSVLYEEGLKCFVEATFTMKGQQGIVDLLQANELDEEDVLTVRREIGANGKSRSFINDTPVTLGVLRQFASQLVDLHQQFDTMELGDDGFQREVVDALSNHADLLKAYKAVFSQYIKSDKELQQLKEQKANASKELDYYRFLYDELDEAGLVENEIEELEAELALLSNAENIKQVLEGVSYSLSTSEQPLVQQVRSLVQQLQSLKDVHAGITELSERLQATQIELKDIAGELEDINDRIHVDAQRLDVVNNRLAIGYKLFKKHNVADTNALLAIKNDLEQKLQQVLNIDESITLLESKTNDLLKKASDLASAVSKNRKSVLPQFEEKIVVLLKQVGMPNAILKVAITPCSLTANGADDIQFLFDANRSGRFEPLEKVASGGELSRLMLSIKSIVARSMQMPTLIFDEIDTGISGEAARQAGSIMKDLAQHHQVISITHQPQIAARAEAHYFVYKKEKEGRIKTQVRLLADEERIDTIARMLSGEQITESALQIAKEMVGR